MAVEIKDVLNYIGLDPEKFETMDEVKEAFDAKFTTLEKAKTNEELAKHFTGKRFGAIETEFKQMAKANGVEYDEGELEGKKLEDVMSLTFEKIKAKHGSALEELKSKQHGSTDSRVKKLEADLENQKKAYSDLEALHGSLKETHNTKIKELEGNMTNYKKDVHLSKIMGGVKFRSNVTDLEKAGFNTLLSQKFKFGFDDRGEFIVTDPDGKRLENKEKAGDFLTPEAAIQGLAKESGVWEKPNTGSDRGGSRFRVDGGGDSGLAGRGEDRKPNKISGAAMREAKGS